MVWFGLVILQVETSNPKNFKGKTLKDLRTGQWSGNIHASDKYILSFILVCSIAGHNRVNSFFSSPKQDFHSETLPLLRPCSTLPRMMAKLFYLLHFQGGENSCKYFLHVKTSKQINLKISVTYFVQNFALF